MAKFRKIDPRIWNDAKFRDLSDRGKLVFLMLLTHPHMTSIGAMRGTVEGLASELCWPAKAFREAFREALAKGIAKHDERAALIWLPNFLKYNAPESPNVVKAWIGALDLLPECDLKLQAIQRSKDSAKALPEAFGKAFEEAFGKAFAKTMPYPEPEPEPEPEPSRERPRASARPSRRCPTDFEISDDMRAWAAEHFPAVNVEAETAAMRDHEYRSGKSDWPAAWRSWIRKAAEYNGSGRQTTKDGRRLTRYEEIMQELHRED